MVFGVVWLTEQEGSRIPCVTEAQLGWRAAGATFLGTDHGAWWWSRARQLWLKVKENKDKSLWVQAGIAYFVSSLLISGNKSGDVHTNQENQEDLKINVFAVLRFQQQTEKPSCQINDKINDG